MRRLSSVAAVLAVGALACHARSRPPGADAPVPTVDPALLDRSVSPCEDFYRFACGRWLDSTPLPPDRRRFVRGEDEARDRSARLVRRILEDAGAGKVDPRQRFGRKAGDFYAACTDEADVDARGLAELQAAWARVDAASDLGELEDELARLVAMGIDAPFRLGTRADPGNGARSLLVFQAGGLSLPRRELYLEGELPAAVRGRFEELVRRLLALAGDPPEQASAEAEAVLALETELAVAGQGGDEQAGAPPARVARDQLALRWPGVPWDRLLQMVGAGRLPEVGIGSPTFTARVGTLLVEAPLATWKAYLRWRLAEAMARGRALPGPLVAAWFAFQVGVSTSASELSPRWRHCVDATTRVFGFAVGGAFGRKFLGPAGRDEAAGLAAKVRAAAERRVALEPWLDVASRGRAAAGLERLALQVGYPDAEPDYGELRVGLDTYFRNLLAAGRFEVGQQVARAARPLDRTEWLLAPTSAESRYWPGRGVLAIPAGALQPPLFDRDAPPAVEFGSAGAAIGRELARAVLDQGTGGGDAGPGGGWSEPSRKHLRALLGCVARQLEPGERPSAPSAALAEGGALAQSLADAGGLRFALEAMEEDRPSWPAPVRKLAGFAPEQQFFVGWAQSLCEVGGEDAPSLQDGAEVLPARLRVNGALSELPEFAAAFRCGSGAAMVRPAAARCQVW